MNQKRPEEMGALQVGKCASQSARFASEGTGSWDLDEVAAEPDYELAASRMVLDWSALLQKSNATRAKPQSLCQHLSLEMI